MENIITKHSAQFEEETRRLFHQRGLAILLVGIVVMLLFSLADFIVTEEYFHEFLVYRLSCAAGLALLLLPYYSRFGRRHPFLLSLIAYVMAGGTMALMVVSLGGYGSTYFMGFIIVLMAFSAILPFDVRQSLATGTMLLLMYIIPIVVFTTPTDETFGLFFRNVLAFVVFVGLSVMKCYEDTRARRKEFDLRMELDSLFEKYRDVVEHISDGIYEVDLSGRIIFLNPAACRLAGYTREEMLGVGYQAVTAEEDHKLLRTAFDMVYRTGQPRSFQWRLRRKQATRGAPTGFMTVESSINPVLDRDGGIVGFRGVFRDVTEQKEMEERLQHMAYYDMLTGLPNRSLFYGLYPLAVARGRRYPLPSCFS
jgi:PAS domain S-box-containing protein